MSYEKKSLKDYFKFTPKQLEAYKHVGKGKVIFYGGARGGGKTHFARATAVLTALQRPGIKICLIRKTFTEVEQQFKNIIESDYPAEVFRYKYIAMAKKFKFLNGSEIYLRSLDKSSDIDKIQGIEYQYIIIDEANQYDKEKIEDIRGSLRNARIDNWTATMLLTGNPGGKSDYYFKTRFVEPDYSKWEENELRYKDVYVFVSAKVEDNPHVGSDYKAQLEGMRDSRRDAWLHGIWGSFEGKFFDNWNEQLHIVDDFDIPENWNIYVGFDVGFSKKHPSVGLWVAQNPDTLECYVVREYIDGTGSLEDHAIYFRDTAHEMRYPLIYADPALFKDSSKKTNIELSNAEIFYSHGVSVVPADNGREDGWRHLKQWMYYLPERTIPKLRFFKSCYQTIENMPMFRYNPRALVKREDLDTDQAFDDIADALRYVMKSAFMYPPTEHLVLNNEGQLELVEWLDDIEIEATDQANVWAQNLIEANKYLRKHNGFDYGDRYK
jgi:phage terminase large subunit